MWVNAASIAAAPWRDGATVDAAFAANPARFFAFDSDRNAHA
jgi:hypothetical protein